MKTYFINLTYKNSVHLKILEHVLRISSQRSVKQWKMFCWSRENRKKAKETKLLKNNFFHFCVLRYLLVISNKEGVGHVSEFFRVLL